MPIGLYYTLSSPWPIYTDPVPLLLCVQTKVLSHDRLANIKTRRQLIAGATVLVLLVPAGTGDSVVALCADKAHDDDGW